MAKKGMQKPQARMPAAQKPQARVPDAQKPQARMPATVSRSASVSPAERPGTPDKVLAPASQALHNMQLPGATPAAPELHVGPQALFSWGGGSMQAQPVQRKAVPLSMPTNASVPLQQTAEGRAAASKSRHANWDSESDDDELPRPQWLDNLPYRAH